MKFKKITLWMLVCGMICMPVQQVHAEISNNTLKAMIAMSIGAGSVFAYILYKNYNELCKDYFRFEIASTEADDKPFKKESQFNDLVDYLVLQFKDEKLAHDFDVRIIALYLHICSQEECLALIDVIKYVAHAQAKPLSMKHFIQAVFILQSNFNDEELQHQEQSLSDKAYHQAAHAVAIIELMNPHVALYNISLSLSDGIDTCFIYVPIVHDLSYEQQLKFIEDSVMYYLAGGIGEQLCNVSPLGRLDSCRDISEYTKRSDYEYIEMITRQSVQNDFEIAQSMVNSLLRINLLKAGKISEESLTVDSQLIWNHMVSAYFKMHDILKNCTDKIEKIAELLVTQGCVSADEAYAICGKKRPLFYFEKE